MSVRWTGKTIGPEVRVAFPFASVTVPAPLTGVGLAVGVWLPVAVGGAGVPVAVGVAGVPVAVGVAGVPVGVGVASVLPVPSSDTISGLPATLSNISNCPVRSPISVGVNLMLIVHDRNALSFFRTGG